MEIYPGIHLLKHPCGTSWTGMILIVREKIVLIDTAFEAAIDSLLYPYLEKLNLKPEGIDIIINTHLHGDHFSGNARLLKETGAKLAAYETGVEKLRDPYPFLNKIRSRFFRLVPFQAISSGLVPLEADIVLHDGDKVDLGDSELLIIYTPGHDTESICIFDSQSGCLFSGDSLQGQGTLSAGVAFYQDLAAYRNSLKKIEAISGQVKCLIGGHPFVPTDGVIYGEKVKAFLDLCQDTLNQYDRELRTLLKSHNDINDLKFFTESLLEKVGLNVHPTVPVLAYHTVAEHLKEIQETL